LDHKIEDDTFTITRDMIPEKYKFIHGVAMNMNAKDVNMKFNELIKVATLNYINRIHTES
jgi:hypothetical protein